MRISTTTLHLNGQREMSFDVTKSLAGMVAFRTSNPVIQDQIMNGIEVFKKARIRSATFNLRQGSLLGRYLLSHGTKQPIELFIGVCMTRIVLRTPSN